jgi:hypothetical protein
MRRRQEILAVVIKQYGTGLYRTCVSLNRENVTCLGEHEDEGSAAERISLFWKAYDEGTIRNSEDLRKLSKDSKYSNDRNDRNDSSEKIGEERKSCNGSVPDSVIGNVIESMK